MPDASEYHIGTQYGGNTHRKRVTFEEGGIIRTRSNRLYICSTGSIQGRIRNGNAIGIVPALYANLPSQQMKRTVELTRTAPNRLAILTGKGIVGRDNREVTKEWFYMD